MRAIVLAVFLMCLTCTPALLANEASDRTVIEAIDTAYKANRGALNSHGSLRFAYYDGMVEDIRDVTEQNLASKPRKRLSEGHGRYLFSGKKRLYDHSYSAEEYKNNSTKNSRVIFGYRWFTDGILVLIDDLGLSSDRQQMKHGGSIRSTINRMWIDGYMETPLNPGQNRVSSPFDFERVLKEYLTNDSKWMLLELDQNAMLDATQVTNLVLTSMEDSIIWRCWIDRARGAIPLRIYVTGKEQELEWAEENQDVRSLGNGAWLPYKWLHFLWNDPGSDHDLSPKGIRFWEGEVESANLDIQPDDSEFFLDFPEAIAIQNTDGGPTYPASTHWDLKSISPEATATALSLPFNQHQSQVPPARWFPWLPQREWWQNGLLLLAIVLFGLYALYDVIRRTGRTGPDRDSSAKH